MSIDEYLCDVIKILKRLIKYGSIWMWQKLSGNQFKFYFLIQQSIVPPQFSDNFLNYSYRIIETWYDCIISAQNRIITACYIQFCTTRCNYCRITYNNSSIIVNSNDFIAQAQNNSTFPRTSATLTTTCHARAKEKKGPPWFSTLHPALRTRWSNRRATTHIIFVVLQ